MPKPNAAREAELWNAYFAHRATIPNGGARGEIANDEGPIEVPGHELAARGLFADAGGMHD